MIKENKLDMGEKYVLAEFYCGIKYYYENGIRELSILVVLGKDRVDARIR